MVKHTETIRRLLPTNCLSMIDHFVGWRLKGYPKWMCFRPAFHFNTCQANVPFYSTLEVLENQMFSDGFKGGLKEH